MLDCTGFLTRITGKGTIDVHNAKRGPDAPECLRIGDRLVRVTGIEPAAEDGAMGDVVPLDVSVPVSRRFARIPGWAANKRFEISKFKILN